MGEGTYGTVYRAVDTHQNDRVVALKILKPEHATGWDWEESSLLTELESQYVLPIYNADIFDGSPYLATGLATRGALDTKGGLPRLWVSDVLKIVGCAARGLARAHDGGVVHRDVKPANIFWTEDEEAVVGDFGLACALDPSGEVPPGGTPFTLAPEVAAGGNASPKSDIWSLGATAYFLLSGLYPHQDFSSTNTEQAFCAARCARAPTSIRDLAPHVSRRVASSINKALDRNPANRHASMTDFDSSLSARAEPKLDWREADPHEGHIKCWESKPPKSLRVCVLPNDNDKKIDLKTWRKPSDRRITEYCASGGYKRDASSQLRAIFEKLGN